jgi:hypothetical protein
MGFLPAKLQRLVRDFYRILRKYLNWKFSFCPYFGTAKFRLLCRKQ